MPKISIAVAKHGPSQRKFLAFPDLAYISMLRL